MRLARATILLPTLLAAPRLSAAWAQVQQGNVPSGTGSNVITLSATSANNLVVVGVRIQGNTDTLSSVTDDKSNTYACSAALDYSSPARRLYLCYGVQTTGGVTSVTVAYSGTQTHRAYAAEFSGGATSNAAVYDATATNTGSGGTLSVSLTPSATGKLVIGWGGIVSGSTQTFTAGSGYTLYYPTNPDVTQLEYKLSGTTSEIVDFSVTGSPTWGEIAMSFNAADAPTATPTPTNTPTSTPTNTPTPTHTPTVTPTFTPTPTPTFTPTSTPTPTPTNTPGPSTGTFYFFRLAPSH